MRNEELVKRVVNDIGGQHSPRKAVSKIKDGSREPPDDPDCHDAVSLFTGAVEAAVFGTDTTRGFERGPKRLPSPVEPDRKVVLGEL